MDNFIIVAAVGIGNLLIGYLFGAYAERYRWNMLIKDKLLKDRHGQIIPWPKH